MTDAQDTLENRLEQVHCLVTALLLAEETSEDLTARVLSGAFWSVQELINQAKDAFKAMIHERKPNAPVTSGSISGDQFDEFTLPLGKATDILALFEDNLPCPEANGVYVTKDLIREAVQIVEGWKENDQAA